MVKDYHKELDDPRLRLFIWYSTVEGRSDIDSLKLARYESANSKALSVRGSTLKKSKAYKIVLAFLDDIRAEKVLEDIESGDLKGTDDELEAILWKIMRSGADPKSKVSAGALIARFRGTYDGSKRANESITKIYERLFRPLNGKSLLDDPDYKPDIPAPLEHPIACFTCGLKTDCEHRPPAEAPEPARGVPSETLKSPEEIEDLL